MALGEDLYRYIETKRAQGDYGRGYKNTAALFSIQALQQIGYVDSQGHWKRKGYASLAQWRAKADEQEIIAAVGAYAAAQERSFEILTNRYREKYTAAKAAASQLDAVTLDEMMFRYGVNGALRRLSSQAQDVKPELRAPAQELPAPEEPKAPDQDAPANDKSDGAVLPNVSLPPSDVTQQQNVTTKLQNNSEECLEDAPAPAKDFGQSLSFEELTARMKKRQAEQQAAALTPEQYAKDHPKRYVSGYMAGYAGRYRTLPTPDASPASLEREGLVPGIQMQAGFNLLDRSTLEDVASYGSLARQTLDVTLAGNLRPHFNYRDGVLRTLPRTAAAEWKTPVMIQPTEGTKEFAGQFSLWVGMKPVDNPFFNKDKLHDAKQTVSCACTASNLETKQDAAVCSAPDDEQTVIKNKTLIQSLDPKNIANGMTAEKITARIYELRADGALSFLSSEQAIQVQYTSETPKKVTPVMAEEELLQQALELQGKPRVPKKAYVNKSTAGFFYHDFNENSYTGMGLGFETPKLRTSLTLSPAFLPKMRSAAIGKSDFVLPTRAFAAAGRVEYKPSKNKILIAQATTYGDTFRLTGLMRTSAVKGPAYAIGAEYGRYRNALSDMPERQFNVVGQLELTPIENLDVSILGSGGRFFESKQTFASLQLNALWAKPGAKWRPNLALIYDSRYGSAAFVGVNRELKWKQ